MTTREYFGQCYRLEEMLRSDMDELQKLRSMQDSLQGFAGNERIAQTSPSQDAPFTRTVETIIMLEHRIMQEMALKVDLKAQIRTVISAMEDPDERLLLRCRFINSMSWGEVSREMHADRSTVYRWYRNALDHAKVPDHPIVI